VDFVTDKTRRTKYATAKVYTKSTTSTRLVYIDNITGNCVRLRSCVALSPISQTLPKYK